MANTLTHALTERSLDTGHCEWVVVWSEVCLSLVMLLLISAEIPPQPSLWTSLMTRGLRVSLRVKGFQTFVGSSVSQQSKDQPGGDQSFTGLVHCRHQVQGNASELQESRLLIHCRVLTCLPPELREREREREREKARGCDGVLGQG